MSAAGKKLYMERVKGSGKVSGVYTAWDRLPKVAQEVWNDRAAPTADKKKVAKAKQPKPKK